MHPSTYQGPGKSQPMFVYLFLLLWWLLLLVMVVVSVVAVVVAVVVVVVAVVVNNLKGVKTVGKVWGLGWGRGHAEATVFQQYHLSIPLFASSNKGWTLNLFVFEGCYPYLE
jgi:hypothetical protein